ncbi:DUF2808 domain-containing protein (plasmid) [Kovacikia minuta CCNUW1]|uniref:DUF2808 domain-containing protein n=1 Tax=Kovacikia minuta TaxID=2931930 RepID=UPI001CC98674|nr:DUF2808 domain-containing protein [Kovacikia minuta]UBF30391.1 DUF2808 domain-containing protein [Kovacikia minuta CCNUW1]
MATLAVSATQCAATVSLQSVVHASTKYELITQQVETQTAQPQTSQLEPPVETISINQAGQSFFSHPPQLIRSMATQAGAYTPSTYEFTLTVPKDAGQPLKAVKVVQAQNVETIKFDVGRSKAFVGDRLTASSEIRLASVGGEKPANPGEVTIVFDQPVQPGSTVTVALAAQRNPNWGGVYLFGVTAYPAGENGLGQFLGYGRINFYGNSN